MVGASAIAAPSAVGVDLPDFDREMRELDEYVHDYLSKQEPEPECPNHAEELTYEGFSRAAHGLADAFAVAVEGYYGR